MWGYPVPVLGAISPFLEPFRGRLSPNIDNVSEKLTLRYPHEAPWVAPVNFRVKTGLASPNKWGEMETEAELESPTSFQNAFWWKAQRTRKVESLGFGIEG